MKRFSAYFLLFFAPVSVFSAAVEYPPADSSVTFASIQALPFNPPAAKISYGSDEFQYGLLWLPETSSRKALITLIHGGCWLNLYGIDHTYALSTALAQAGYAVWSLEYRRTGDVGGGWPGTFADIQAGVAFIDQLHAYGVTQLPLIIAGHSAGGHLALLAGVSAPQASAVIGLAAITDIITFAQDPGSCGVAAVQFMDGDFDSRPQQYRAANPASLPLHPNTILLQGSADEIVPVSQAQLPGAETILEDEAGHFDWVHPGSPAMLRFLSVLEEQITQ